MLLGNLMNTEGDADLGNLNDSYATIKSRQIKQKKCLALSHTFCFNW